MRFASWNKTIRLRSPPNAYGGYASIGSPPSAGALPQTSKPSSELAWNLPNSFSRSNTCRETKALAIPRVAMETSNYLSTSSRKPSEKAHGIGELFGPAGRWRQLPRFHGLSGTPDDVALTSCLPVIRSSSEVSENGLKKGSSGPVSCDESSFQAVNRRVVGSNLGRQPLT